MSRLGKLPIQIPQGVTAAFDGGVFAVKGPKGELSRRFKTDDVSLAIADGAVTVAPVKETDEAKALWGTYAAHVRNMMEGVTEGFQKQLEIEGVGYRAETSGTGIKLNVGFSHPVTLAIPDGVAVTVEKGLVTISGADKDTVGQFAANVRAVKEPEPYKGKGIHYVGEYIIRKQGKKAV
jgi:large subunit ribosomal protein L6